MPFKLQAQTVIKSATLELTAKQLEELAEASPIVESIITAQQLKSPETDETLEPVVELLSSIASLVGQTGTIRPKRRSPQRKKRNPTGGKSSA